MSQEMVSILAQPLKSFETLDKSIHLLMCSFSHISNENIRCENCESLLALLFDASLDY